MIGRSLGDAFEYIMGSGDDEELWGRVGHAVEKLTNDRA